MFNKGDKKFSSVETKKVFTPQKLKLSKAFSLSNFFGVVYHYLMRNHSSLQWIYFRLIALGGGMVVLTAKVFHKSSNYLIYVLLLCRCKSRNVSFMDFVL